MKKSLINNLFLVPLLVMSGCQKDKTEPNKIVSFAFVDSMDEALACQEREVLTSKDHFFSYIYTTEEKYEYDMQEYNDLSFTIDGGTICVDFKYTVDLMQTFLVVNYLDGSSKIKSFNLAADEDDCDFDYKLSKDSNITAENDLYISFTGLKNSYMNDGENVKVEVKGENDNVLYTNEYSEAADIDIEGVNNASLVTVTYADSSSDYFSLDEGDAYIKYNNKGYISTYYIYFI